MATEQEQLQIAIRNHGICDFDSESDSSGSKSDFDEEYELYRPPPIPLKDGEYEVVKIGAFQTMHYKKPKVKKIYSQVPFEQPNSRKLKQQNKQNSKSSYKGTDNKSVNSNNKIKERKKCLSSFSSNGPNKRALATNVQQVPTLPPSKLRYTQKSVTSFASVVKLGVPNNISSYVYDQPSVKPSKKQLKKELNPLNNKDPQKNGMKLVPNKSLLECNGKFSDSKLNEKIEAASVLQKHKKNQLTNKAKVQLELSASANSILGWCTPCSKAPTLKCIDDTHIVVQQRTETMEYVSVGDSLQDKQILITDNHFMDNLQNSLNAEQLLVDEAEKGHNSRDVPKYSRKSNSDWFNESENTPQASVHNCDEAFDMFSLDLTSSSKNPNSLPSIAAISKTFDDLKINEPRHIRGLTDEALEDKLFKSDYHSWDNIAGKSLKTSVEPNQSSSSIGVQQNSKKSKKGAKIKVVEEMLPDIASTWEPVCSDWTNSVPSSSNNMNNFVEPIQPSGIETQIKKRSKKKKNQEKVCDSTGNWNRIFDEFTETSLCIRKDKKKIDQEMLHDFAANTEHGSSEALTSLSEWNNSIPILRNITNGFEESVKPSLVTGAKVKQKSKKKVNKVCETESASNCNGILDEPQMDSLYREKLFEAFVWSIFYGPEKLNMPFPPCGPQFSNSHKCNRKFGKKSKKSAYKEKTMDYYLNRWLNCDPHVDQLSNWYEETGKQVNCRHKDFDSLPFYGGICDAETTNFDEQRVHTVAPLKSQSEHCCSSNSMSSNFDEKIACNQQKTHGSKRSRRRKRLNADITPLQEIEANTCSVLRDVDFFDKSKIYSETTVDTVVNVEKLANTNSITVNQLYSNTKIVNEPNTSLISYSQGSSALDLKSYPHSYGCSSCTQLLRLDFDNNDKCEHSKTFCEVTKVVEAQPLLFCFIIMVLRKLSSKNSCY